MKWAARALALDPDDDTAHYNIASVYALLGEADRAINLLEVLLPGSPSDRKQWFKHDSDFDNIRGHPRYRRLLELIG